ncbi:MAG: O-Antigen ligase [Herminiimonas sp.]|nr:O-Antigen ligase [Herminiimonas sp.]
MLSENAKLEATQFFPLFRARYGLALHVRYGGRALLRKYLSVVLVVVVVFSYLNLPTYFFVLKSALLPKYFYYAFVAALVPLIASRVNIFVSYLFTPAALWIIAFITVNMLHLLFASAIDVNIIRTKFIETQISEFLLVLVLGFGFFYSFTASYERAFPLLAVLMPLGVIVDFLRPGLFYPIDYEGAVIGRAAATFINPNVAGEAILLTFVLSCSAINRNLRAPVFILTGLATVVTYSRAAMGAWIFLAILLTFTRVLPKAGVILIVVAAGTAAILFGGFEHYLNSRYDLVQGLSNIQDRLRFFVDMNVQDDSALERREVLVASWRMFLENPLVGAGAGATRVWSSFHVSPHNTLLLQAAEYGFTGIVLWISAFMLVLRGKYFKEKGLQWAIAFLFIYFSMFSHNLFDYTYWLVTVMLVAGIRKTSNAFVWARIA